MIVARVRLAAAVFVSLVLLFGCATGGDTVDNQRAAEANAGLAADFLRRGNNQQAATHFKRALGYDDSNVSANWGMAIASDRLGNPERARRYYNDALALQSRPDIVNSYAAFLCKQGDVSEAVGYFKQAAGNPRYAGRADALANAGLCLQRDGQAQVAERYYRDALAADASQVTALAQMAQLEYAQQNYLRARAFIERADAVTELNAEQLMQGARIELALGDREAARAYLERHNTSQPAAALSLSQLEQSRE